MITATSIISKLSMTAATGAVKTAIEVYKNKLHSQLLFRLNQGEIDLNDPRLREDKFISSFIRTEEALRKAESKKKLDLLIDLFINGIKDSSVFTETSAYHETIHTLGEMSYREILFVYYLDAYCRTNNKDSTQEFNPQMMVFFKKEMDLGIEDVFSLTRRLYSTGFVKKQNLVGEGDFPIISPTYRNVLDIIHQYFNQVQPAS